MTKQQQQLVMLGVLGLVMVAVYARKPTSRRPPAVPTPTQTQPPSQPAAEEHAAPSSGGVQELILPASAQREAQRVHAAHLAWNRDPFTRGGSSAGMTGLTLSGILWDATAPMAILNGQMLRVGEELDGYRIVEIHQDRVAVTDGTETFQLQIAP